MANMNKGDFMLFQQKPETVLFNDERKVISWGCNRKTNRVLKEERQAEIKAVFRE